MNTIFINVSKDKSVVAIKRPFDETISTSFETKYTTSYSNSFVELINPI